MKNILKHKRLKRILKFLHLKISGDHTTPILPKYMKVILIISELTSAQKVDISSTKISAFNKKLDHHLIFIEEQKETSIDQD